MKWLDLPQIFSCWVEKWDWLVTCQYRKTPSEIKLNTLTNCEKDYIRHTPSQGSTLEGTLKDKQTDMMQMPQHIHICQISLSTEMNLRKKTYALNCRPATLAQSWCWRTTMTLTSWCRNGKPVVVHHDKMKAHYGTKKLSWKHAAVRKHK